MIGVVSGTRPNVFAERFSTQRHGLRSEPVVRAAGGELLGGTLYELAIVISGRPTLRTLEGESELAPGDVVAFPRGRRGGHTVANRTDAPVRYLMVSNKVMPELVEYPEDGTVRALTRGRFDPPKADEDPADRLNLRFKRSDAEEQ
jgi:Cupin domain